MHHPTLSRDGKRVAVWSHDSFKPNGFNRAQDITNDGMLRVYDVDKPDEPIAKFEHKHANRILFTPDGQILYTMEQSEPYSQQAKEVTFAVYRIDLKTKKKVKLNLLAEHHLADISPDGKTLLTTMFAATDGKFQAIPHRVPLDTLKPEPLTKISIRSIQFSPDGRRFIGSKYVEPMNPGRQELAVVDLKDGKDAAVKLDGETLMVWGAAWAPDGKRLVVNRTVILGNEKAKGPLPIPVGGGKQPDEVLIQKIEVTIRNLDGSDPRACYALKGGGGYSLAG